MVALQQNLFGGCNHDQIDEVVFTAGKHPHYGKRECHDCHKFLGWIPKPETVARQLRNNEILTALSKMTLPPWERQFIRDLASHKNLSPRQQAKLLELEEFYLSK